MEKMIFNAFFLVNFICVVYGNRFKREELGVPDRLRFTSGQNNFYECDIINNQLVSDLKIGIHIYTHKSVIQYSINGTTNFDVTTEKVEDFYFAHVRTKGSINLKESYLVHLVARNGGGDFVDGTLLKVTAPKVFTSSAPVFLNDSVTNLEIYDDVFVGSSIGKLLVKNQQDVPMIFYLSKEDSLLLREFGITADGRIIVTKRLSSKKHGTIPFKVYCRHVASSPSSYITLKITVKPGVINKTPASLREIYNVDSFKPAYTSSRIHVQEVTFWLSEFAQKHTIVGNVGLKDVSRDVIYNISKGNEDNAFHINGSTGVITVYNQKKIDYEVKRKYLLTVKWTKQATNVTSQVTINIIDENDNAPSFSKDKYIVSVPEDAKIGSTIIKLDATDKDSGNNGLLNYVFDNRQPVPFLLEPDGTIIVAESLDFIKQNARYYLYVKALDSGFPIRRESEALVEVNVRSVNTHKPVLKQSSCTIVVNSNSVSLDIMKLEALDKDIDDMISYRFSKDNNMFSINKTSGMISLKDKAEKSSVELNVYAFDGFHKSDMLSLDISFKEGEGSVTCHPNDEYIEIKKLIKARKDFPKPTKLPPVTKQPTSSLLFLKTPGDAIHISETSKVNSVLGQYVAINPNVQSYGLVLYSIIKGNVGSKFQIDLFNGTLFLRDRIDKETNAVYLLEIQVSDGNGLKTSTKLRVKIDDVDYSPPVFEKNGRYDVEVTEKKNVGLDLVKVKANKEEKCSVLDCGLVYSFVNPSSIFEINAKTGAVKLISSLSKQPFKEYFIEVQALDPSSPKPVYGYAVVHITVVGFTNRPPRCLSDEQRIEVPTSTPSGVIIGRVVSYDADKGKAGKVTYVVKNKDNIYFDAYFSLNKKSGLLTLKKDLSTQDKGIVFKIEVEVTDQATSPLSITCHVYKIIVDGVGVAQPSFVLKKYPIATYIPYNSSSGTFVTKVQAVLPSNDTTRNLRYELIDGSGIGLFTIDSVRGSIYVVKNSITKPFYWLTVQAYTVSDSANYRNAHVLVNVINKKHRWMFFNPSVYHANLEHTEEIGRRIVKLHVTDGSSRYDLGKVQYGIHAGDKKERFTIDNSGWLKSKGVLDVGYYQLNVTVADIKNTTALSYGYVIINVEPHHSLAPTFVSSGTFSNDIRVFETTSKGFSPPYLFQVLALNPNPDEQITYEDAAGYDTGFIVNKHTGTVKSKNNLVADATTFMAIKATNAAKRSTTIFYTVIVGRRPDVKTNISFRKKHYEFVVMENELGKSVLNFADEITTTHIGYRIYYYILSGNDQLNFYFSSSGDTTELKVVSPLDYERKPFHKLEVLAFDGSSYATCEVKITVKNNNDNRMTTSQACYQARIPENTREFSEIISVKVTDPDETLIGMQYSMVNNNNGSSPFVINKQGSITVKQGVKFDRETQSEYIATAVGSFLKENATYCVNVFIEDINDQKPNFTQNVYNIDLLDSTPVGTSVMAVYATDDDSGSNARLSYSFSKENEYFGIRPKTGVVYTKKTLEKISNRILTLKTRATDHGSKPFSATTKLKIKISTDHRKLEFAQSSYTFSVSENLPRGTLVTDIVKVNVSRVHYEIVGKKPDDCSSKFWIGIFNGIIFTEDVLDSEEFRQCEFMVHGLVQNKMVASANVLVKVEDVNDNKPTFRNASYFGHVSESQNSNTNILKSDGRLLFVDAVDKDDGRNGDIRYSFVEETTKLYFNIDERTGEIKTNDVLDCEKHPNEFTFHVKASDQGAPIALSSTVMVTINVNNINDRVPEFVNQKLLSIQLPAYKGTGVGQLEAVDYDIIPEKLVFGLDDQSGIFDIHKTTGEIFVKNPTGLASRRMMKVRAKVSDSKFHSAIMVQIQIIRYKEHETFKFLPSAIIKTVTEVVENKDPVGVVNPIGYEKGEQIHFRILNPLPEFTIGKVSGVLNAAPGVIFDRETTPRYVVHIEAWKVANPKMVARMSVNFTVVDVNDNAPVFVQKKFYKPIYIDNNVGTELTVTATDADIGDNAKIRYTIIGGDGAPYFSCHPDTGAISLKRKFTKTQGSQKYMLKVQASDYGQPSLSSVSTVVMYLINKDQPMFVSNYFGEAAEDAQPGQPVVKVAAKGRNDRQVYYEIVDGDQYDQFHIGFTSGEVIVAGKLDYSKRSHYNIKVRAIDSLTGSWSDTTCDIEIIDINDHYPIFEKPFYKADVSENTVQGSTILKVSAHDSDVGKNGDIEYSITSLTEQDANFFEVDKRTGTISLATMLDVETKNVHRFKVVATDKGIPSKSSFTLIEVNVVDENDSEPQFLASTYVFTYDQYKDEAHYVGQVHAFDADISGKLKYFIEPRSKFVMVSEETGSVYLQADPGSIVEHKVTISVTDGLHQASVEVLITCTGANQHAPELPKAMTAYVKENDLSKVSLVTQIKADDPDMGNYGHVSFYLDDNHYSDYFTLREDGSLFTTGVEFDREDISEFILAVRAVDGGGLFSLSSITVLVEDENDNTPQFEFSNYEANVMTSQMTAESLVHALAIDRDSGVNAELKYVAHGLENDSPLLVDNNTGLISLAGYPKGADYQFSVQVSDNGYPILQSRTNIKVSVRSWNHHILTFVNKSYAVNVLENAKKGMLLTQVQAEFKDFEGETTYEFVEGNLPYTKTKNLFSINSKDGKIYLDGELDYEKMRNYKLLVKARAQNGDSANCYVLLNVVNVNDNPPKFDSKVITIKIVENTPVDTEIIQIKARDPDDPTGKNLQYRIKGGDFDYFKIDTSTGLVTVKKELDREQKDSHEFTVSVIDTTSDSKGSTISTDEQKVKVILIDVNDSPPKFTQSKFTVKENAVVSQHIGTLKTRDLDLNTTVRYYFKPDQTTSKVFAVNSVTGTITLLRPLEVKTYEFEALAYDCVNMESVKVEIRVNKTVNEPPVCVKSYYKVKVTEDHDINKPLAKIRAVKEDDLKIDSIMYSVQGEGKSKFTINAKSGELKALKALDYESTSSENFKIVVTDKYGHSCDSDVFMELEDTNDNTPVFDQELYMATIRENVSQSVVVAQVRATDLDTYDNHRLSYSIIKNNINNVFGINQRGVVTVVNPSGINRKNQPAYSLVIQANDHGDPQRSTTTKLQIVVLSVSDIPPQFDMLGYEFNITENNKANAAIGRINVVASKNLKHEKILISVVNDHSKNFFIEGGQLKTKGVLDYETQSRYSFDVKAWYQMIPTLSSTVNVEVQITDENDHVPTFKEKSFLKRIDENVRSGTFFLQVSAEDKDGSRKNSIVTYKIIGEPDLPFTIVKQSGLVLVNDSIDHEVKNFYEFLIEASDNGTPQFSSRVTVTVNITDLNDNAPIISDYNTSVIVQEKKPIGSDLITVSIRDEDSPKNGAPFECMLLKGDETKFEVDTIDGGTKCVVRTKGLFNKMERDKYEVEVRAKDSGSPTQFSDCKIKIIVVEESYHPPVILDPKVFYVIVAPPYGWMKIGQVKVFDQDKTDIHQFRITDGNDENLFHIQPMSGVIEGKPTEGSYSISVEVTDGKYPDSSVFNIIVNEFNEKLKIQSISMLVNGVDVPTFMNSRMVDLVRLIAKLSGTVSENVFIWSVLDANERSTETGSTSSGGRKRREANEMKGVVIAVAVKTIQGNDYIDPSNLKSYIESSIADFEQLYFDVSVRTTACVSTKCPENQKCRVTLVPKDDVFSLHLPTGYMSFKSEERCYCADGSEGPVCLETNPCSHNPCKIGERCVVTSSDIKCECIDYKKCNPTIETVTLTGESYITYHLKKSFDELFTTLSMKFRTEATATEYLFYAYGKDFFILEIDESGHIKARFDFGSGVGFLVVDGRKVNDGNWHYIHVERYGNYVAMVLDKKDSLKKETRAPGNSAKININGHGIQIGAGLSHDGKPFSGFKGCIKEPKLNKQRLPFSGSNDIIFTVDAHKVDPDCKDSGRCTVDKCPRFSDCVNTLSSYRCPCLPDHYGPRCITKLTCKNNPCKNGGRCTYEQALDGSVSYKCTCKQGFSGGQCHIPLGPCATRPCLNGGKCLAINDNSYVCQCSVGFTGPKCSINTNPCSSSPCRNGGKCLNKYNDFKCICPSGKYGKQCSRGENCLFDKCLNGGTCIEKDDDGVGSVCSCMEGYFGLRCQHDVDECLLTGNCKHSTCVNTLGDYYCNCTNGDKLKSCPVASTADSEDSLPLLYLIIGGAAGLLLLIICLIICCCCWKKRTKRDAYPHDSHIKYPLNRYLPHDGADELAMFPPSPPPRGEMLPPAYYEESDQASAAMYDPSMVTFSGTSSPDECIKVPLKFSPTRTSLEYNSEEEEMKSLPGYHWDYSEVPEDIIIRKMSREGSRILPTKSDQYFDDENLEYVEMPELPERPVSRRSSLPGYSESDADIPELPALPQQVQLSRQSLRSSNSPTNMRQRINPITSSEFRHRYSLLSDHDNQDTSYLHDDDNDEEETMSELTRVTRPRMPGGYGHRRRYESESSASDEIDGFTETSFNSDDDATEHDPLDPANTRKLERDIQRLIKDLQRRTEED